MNYEFNLLHHVGVVAKTVCAAAAAAAAHEGEDNTPSGPTGRGVKMAKGISPLSSLVLLYLLIPEFHSSRFGRMLLSEAVSTAME